MDNNTITTWVDEAVIQEATPKALRKETTRDFCARHGIPESNYYYHVNKADNKKRILEITLNVAKSAAPEVLEILVSKAMEGDMRAIDLYMDMILQLSKNIDVKTNGLSIVFDKSFNKGETTREAEGGDTVKG